MLKPMLLLQNSRRCWAKADADAAKVAMMLKQKPMLLLQNYDARAKADADAAKLTRRC
jgi:hypothetical protein